MFENVVLSIYSLPILWFVGFYPHVWSYLIITKTIGWEKVQPRSNIERFESSKAVPPELLARVMRMRGAHLNGTEAFPMWAAAVLAGHISELDQGFLNKMSLLYIATRVAYNHVYISTTKEEATWMRSALFITGNFTCFTLFVKSAMAFGSR